MLTALLAHQGGWDEVLIPLALIAGLFIWTARRGHDGGKDAAMTRSPVCAYWRAPLDPTAKRCANCGFRAR